MENIKLAIITKDRDYGRALSLALVDVYKTFTVTLYQSEPVHKTLEQFDLVLKDGGDCEESEGSSCVYLVEKPSMIQKDYENRRFRLYKYNNVRLLAGELLFIYSSLTGRKAVPLKKRDVKLIAFCCCQGGAGCTSAAMAFAREMKRFRGKEVLYLSLEELESTLEYMEAFPDGKSISEYLYYLFREDSRDRFPFIESFLVFDSYGVEAFAPSPGRNALKSLSLEEMPHFIGAVTDIGRYDMIVMDLGCSLDQNALCCMEMAGNICLVTKGENRQKEERLVEYVAFAKGEAVIERMGKVINCCKQRSWQEEETEALPELLKTVCRLPEDPQSFTAEKGLRIIRPEGAYGKGISSLADAVLRM